MNIHGGFWRNKYDLQHAGHFCGALSAAGLATWNVEYRRVGDGGGGWPGTLDDVRAAWHCIPQLAAQHKLEAERMIVVGHSAGGQLAICLGAYEGSVRNIVALAGVLDLRRAWELHLSSNAVAEFLAGAPEDVPQHYGAADPMHLALPQTTQWLLHGAEDEVVAPDFSKAYHDRKNKLGEDVHLLGIPAADHFDLIDPRSAAWAAVESTIIRLIT